MANLQNDKRVKIRMDDMISQNFFGPKILVTFTVYVLLRVSIFFRYIDLITILEGKGQPQSIADGLHGF